jgi:hypothetical protein
VKLKKLQCLLYTLVFCLAVCCNALAADGTKDLIAWSSNPAPVSSDPAGTLDYLEPGNPNERLDVAMLKCELVDDHNLEVYIGPNPDKKGGAYPGYQASVTATIVNTTSDQVQITGVEVIEKPEAISVSITDPNDNDLNLVGKVLNANQSIQVKVTTKVTEAAHQNATYKFRIRIDARQEVSEYEPPGGGGGGGGGLPNEPVEIPPGGEPLSPPEGGEGPGEQEEPIELPKPLEALAELPYTGGNVALFMGTALSLCCIGLVMRYKP